MNQTFIKQPRLNESELIARSKEGDREAFGQLYERHQAAILRYVKRQLASSEDAEDVTSEVFLQAWTSIPEFHYKGVPISSWFYRLARSAVGNHYRSLKTPTQPISTDICDNLVDDKWTHDPYEVCSLLSECEAVRKAVLRLRENERQLIHFLFEEDIGYQGASLRMHRKVPTLRNVLWHSVTSLRQMMAEEEVA